MDLEIIKQMVPSCIKNRIKMGKEIYNFSYKMNELEKETQDITLMLGTPIHTNLGDHLITLAQYKFLEEIGYTERVIEIPTEMFQVYKKRLVKMNQIKNVFINGGGWMGNLWLNEELLLQEMVNAFKDRKIVIFPQAIYFDRNLKPYNTLIDSANNIFKNCKNLTLCVREENSYHFAKKNYSGIKVLLIPDIAIAYYRYAPKNNHINDKKVGVCLRKDREEFRNSASVQTIFELLEKQNYSFVSIDTMYSHRVPTYMRKEIVNKRLKEFSECTYIVTDRLHGMIFSFITDTPCIVLDNKTHKVSGVYAQWFKESYNIFTVFNELHVQSLLNFLEQNTEKNNIDVLLDKFSVLKEII